MTPAQSIKSSLRKYFQFSGRASRREYWLLLGFAAVGLALFVGIDIGLLLANISDQGTLSALYCLGMIIPIYSAYVRRIHDTDRRIRAVLAQFWGLVPFTLGLMAQSAILTFIGCAVLILGKILITSWVFQKGTSGENRFGPDPYASDAD